MRFFIVVMPFIVAILAMFPSGAVETAWAPKVSQAPAFCSSIQLVQTKTEKLVQAKTEKPLEPVSFWVDITNDEKLETWRRGLAIYFLFDRHVKKSATLAELAEVLKRSKWIKKDSVFVARGWAGGEIPMSFTDGDTMIAIEYCSKKDLATHNKECVVIWINVTGKIERDDFISAMINPEKSKHGNTRIKGWAVIPKWDEYNRRIR